MAKKKLNKRFAAAAVTTAIVVGGGGFVSFKYLYNNVRPQQRKAEGRAAMDRGDYVAAVGAFAGMGTRLSGDVEFIRWFYEAQNHLTSFDEANHRQARSRLDAITNADPKNVWALNEKLRFDLRPVTRFGIESATGPMTKIIDDTASRLLEIEPDNRLAMRGKAAAKIAPFFETAALPTSADVQTARDYIATLLDGVGAADAELTLRYAQVTVKLRDALLRERAFASGTDPRALALGKEVETRVEAVLNALPASSTTKPAGDGATSQPAATPNDDIARSLMLAVFADEAGRVGRLYVEAEMQKRSLERMATLLPRAAELATPADPDTFFQARVAYSSLLVNTNRQEEAERQIRGLVEGLPLAWTPRLLLAQHLADRGRAAEAVDVLSVDLKPDHNLVGLDGRVFALEAPTIPLQRALYRVQSIGTLPADKRDAAIAAAEADYKLGIGRIGEADPRALQVKAGLQDARQDRTGAIQTLTQALNAQPNDQLRLKIMESLVSLNLALRQTGAAADMLDQIWARSQNPNTLLRLIELNANNGRLDAARSLLEDAKRRLPNHPAVIALEVRLMTSSTERQAALSRLPEDTAPVAIMKMKLAAQASEPAIAREVAQRAIAKFPDNLDLKAGYAEILLRLNDRPAAVQLLEELAKARPDDKTVAYLLETAKADTAAARQQIANEFVEENVTDPYRRAIVDAERARVANDEATYVAKLEEAVKLDQGKDGAAADRLFIHYLSRGKVDDAERALTLLAASKRDPAQIRVARIRLLLARTQFEAALQQANAVTSELPGFSGGWQVKALAHAALGQFPEAVKAYDAALAAEPNNIEIVRAALESADRSGQPATLKRLIDQGKALAPNDPIITDWALRYQANAGDAVGTIPARVKMRDAQPEQPSTWLALISAHAVAAQQRAAAGDATGATQYRKQAIEIANQAADKFPAIAAFRLQSAGLNAVSGDRAAADAIVQKLATDPKLGEEPSVQIALGNYYLDQQQVGPALAMYDKAIASGKAGDEVKIRAAQIRAAGNDIDGALRQLDGATETPQTREIRINILFAANRPDEAKAFADAALAKERSPSNLLLAAIVASRRGDDVAARKFVDDAVAVDPKNPAARFARVRLMMATPNAKNDDVLADLDVVRKETPQNIEARLLMVDRLELAGRVDESRAELEAMQRDKAIKENPTAYPQVATRMINRLLNDRPVRPVLINTILEEAKGISPNNVQLLTLESNFALERGENARAVEAIRAAAKAAGPQDLGAFRRMLNVMMRAGAADRVLTELDARKAELDTAYWAYLTRGVALHRLKRDAEATPVLDRSLELAGSLVDDAPMEEVVQTYAEELGGDAAATWIRAKVPAGVRQQALIIQAYASKREYDKLVASAEGFVAASDQLKPAIRANALSNLGVAALAVTPPRADVARQAFEKLLSLDPSNVMMANNLAYAMTLEGSGATPAQAAEIAKKAFDQVSASGGSAVAYIGDTYGWTLVLSGEIDRGIEVLRKARQAQALPEIDLHLGEAFIRQKQPTAAREALQNALANIEKLKQNQKAVDPSLAGRVNDALVRASTMPQ